MTVTVIKVKIEGMSPVLTFETMGDATHFIELLAEATDRTGENMPLTSIWEAEDK